MDGLTMNDRYAIDMALHTAIAYAKEQRKKVEETSYEDKQERIKELDRDIQSWETAKAKVLPLPPTKTP